MNKENQILSIRTIFGTEVHLREPDIWAIKGVEGDLIDEDGNNYDLTLIQYEDFREYVVKRSFDDICREIGWDKD